MAGYDDYEDDFEAEPVGLTFDDMVSFTMIAEMGVVLVAAGLFICLLYFTY
jgi:hypothetical protein